MSKERLPATHPHLVAEWSDRNPYPPKAYSYGCRDKVWWKCSVCGNEWQAKINNRSHGSGCPYCHRGSADRVVKGFNDFATFYPEIAAEWSDKNLPLLPDKVRKGSKKKVWWKCSKGHEWRAEILSRVRGNNCPICGNRVLLKGFNDFASHYPELAAEWSDRNSPLTPDGILYTYGKRVWWKCKVCGNEYEYLPRTRITGSKCPFCTGKIVKEGFNDLKSKRPDLSAEWDVWKNEDHTPESVFVNSGWYAWWICPAGHSWRCRIRERTEEGKVCPECLALFSAVLTLLLLARVLTDEGIRIVPSFKVNTGSRLELYVPELKLAVETEGVSVEKRTEQDKKKKQCAESGIRYITVKPGRAWKESIQETETILRKYGKSVRCTEDMVWNLWKDYQAVTEDMRKEGKNE